MNNKNVDSAIQLLKKKALELNRVPKKADMTSEEIIFIKSQLGPWPRALESAGLKIQTKEPKNVINKRKRYATRERKKLYNQNIEKREETNNEAN